MSSSKSTLWEERYDVNTNISLKTEYKAKCIMHKADDGYQIQFICALCGYNYTTGWIRAGTELEARALTEKEARKYFNGCMKCGKWVCDKHYNMEEMMCIKCAPWKK